MTAAVGLAVALTRSDPVAAPTQPDPVTAPVADPVGAPVPPVTESACTPTTFTSQGSSHDPSPSFGYNSFPPTSGPAWLEPLPFRVFDTPVDQVRLLHNLAHGGIAVQYGAAVPSSAVDEIERWYLEQPRV